ncbi:MAG: hypothetical protein HFE73_09665 [Firmicutes bacterium]|nr:hypothetical protein [Bacillota bacterium]
MLNIYYSREDVDKEKFIFDRIKAHGASSGRAEPRALLIVPDQYTLEAEQQAFRYLGAEGLMDVEVLSMSRLGSRILSELGGTKQTFIDKYGRHMILAQVAREERERLQVFRGLETRNSFIEMVNNFISELKQYNCGIGDLKAMAQEAGQDTYTGRKLADLSLLYGRYEERIKGKYTDSEDYIDLFLSKIQRSALIEDNQVWIYGFDSFAPKALSVIGQLIAKAAQVHVVVTWDQSCQDQELFYLTGIVMENLEKTAASVGAESRRSKIPQSSPSVLDAEITEKKAPAMAHIERQLYALPSRKSEDGKGVTLVAAAGLYNEAESAASYILYLVREQGLKYRDIRVVCNDQEIRGPIIKRVFQEYGLEIFSDSSRDILSSPVVQYLLALLDAVMDGWRTEDLFRVLKSGFGPLTREQVTKLENYAVKYRIRRKGWKRSFTKGVSEYGEEGISGLDTLRQKAMEPGLALEKLTKKQNQTTADFIYGLYSLLYEEVKLPDRILGFMEQQEELGRVDLAEETGQIWGCIIGILDQMIEIMGAEGFDGKVFTEIFQAGLSQVEIGMLPPTKDGLVMGAMQRTRISDIEALVVIGANEGILPQEDPAAGLFSREEKELFEQKGHALCKVDSVALMEERLAIYRNLSKPRRYLWMSYALADGEGKACKPSAIYLKLKSIFPGLKEERDVLNQQNPLPLIHGGVSGLRHLTEALQQVCDGEGIDDEWLTAIDWYGRNKPEAVAVIGDGLAFTNSQESLGKYGARQLYLKNPEGAISLSPSRLERFSRCPFSHFVAYGLRPEERRVFQIAPREIGDIYHECLMTLTRTLTREDLEVTHPLSPWMTVTRDQCRALVEETARQQLANYREGLFCQGKEETYRSQRIFDICDKVCWTVVEQVRAGQIVRNDFEVGFRRGGQIPAIEVQAGEETVYIEGKIDRVDYLPDERVKIIDYKTGNENFSVKEAKAGYRLQLMLYLKAACEEVRRPAGVFYFKISEPLVDGTGKDLDRETLEQEIRKNFKLNGVMVDDPQVIENIAGDFSGFSDIVPLRAGKEKVTGTSKESLLSEEDFAGLMEETWEKTKAVCNRLVEGDIKIHPMKTKERSACTFCQYRGICRFDTVFAGCSYEIV